MREAYYVISVLANVLRVNRLTSFLAGAEIQPRVSFEGNQSILADPRQSAAFPATGKHEVVVRIIEQDSGQTRNNVVERDGSEATAVGKQDAIR